MSKYTEMSYGDLQAEAKKEGLKASGNKDALLERLEAKAAKSSDKADTVEEPETEDNVEQEEKEPTEEPKEPVATKPAAEREIEREWRGDAAKMKEHLAKQKKVSIMIPLEVGVAPEVAEKIPFTVNLNGYRFSIKRGTFVEVPEQVAEIVKERLESEGKIGNDKRIDRDQNTLEALG